MTEEVTDRPGMDAEPQLLDDAFEDRVLALWRDVLGIDADALDHDGVETRTPIGRTKK